MTKPNSHPHGYPEQAPRDSAGPAPQALPYPAQFLIAAHQVRPEWAAMLAALVFDGGAQ